LAGKARHAKLVDRNMLRSYVLSAISLDLSKCESGFPVMLLGLWFGTVFVWNLYAGFVYAVSSSANLAFDWAILWCGVVDVASSHISNPASAF
jgi:hypothetical protein